MADSMNTKILNALEDGERYLNGRMIDEAMEKRARRVLKLAEMYR